MSKVIEAVDIRKTFKTEAGELQVLRGVDVTIGKSEMVGIIGASGAGKSTLLYILGSLDRPSSGKVVFQGRDVTGMSDDDLAVMRNSSIGFVFQFHHLLPEFTAIENVMMPGLISGRPADELEKNAKELLSELGLSERFSHRPGELSGGEQQRVAVARALIQNPSLVLADEPTGNLDTATGNDLFETLLGVNKRRGTAFVIVTHNQALSARCHRVLEMADGLIIP